MHDGHPCLGRKLEKLREKERKKEAKRKISSLSFTLEEEDEAGEEEEEVTIDEEELEREGEGRLRTGCGPAGRALSWLLALKWRSTSTNSLDGPPHLGSRTSQVGAGGKGPSLHHGKVEWGAHFRWPTEWEPAVRSLGRCVGLVWLGTKLNSV